MKRLAVCLFLCGMTLSCISYGVENAAVASRAPSGSAPPLHVDGKYFKDAAGNIVVLRGVALIEVRELDVTRPGSRFMIDLITDRKRGWHTQVLRLPVFADPYFADPQGYYKDHLKPAVDYCTEKGLYCIIDWHYADDPYRRANETRRFWTDIAPKFRDYPNVFYEIFNEPATPKPTTEKVWKDWRALAQQWVNLIRDAAPDNIILIGGPHYDQHISGAADYPFTGKNLAYVAHLYPDAYYPNFLRINLHQAGWQRHIGVVAEKFPVFVTEWGYGRVPGNESNGTREGFAVPFEKWVDERGISSTAWVADWDWFPTMFDKDWTPNDFGEFVKEFLARKGK